MNDDDQKLLEWDRQKWVEEYYRDIGSRNLEDADGRPLKAGVGCLVMAAVVVGFCFLGWLPSAVLLAVKRTLGIPPYWSMRLLVMGAAAALGLFLYREWSGLRRAATAFGIEKIMEWRARRPDGPHRIPIWHFIVVVGLFLAFLRTWAVPIQHVGADVMAVILMGSLGGLLLGGPIGIVVQIVDRNRLEKILAEKGPLPSIQTRVP